MPRPQSDAVRQTANRRRPESRDALAGALRRCRLELHHVLPDGGLESARPIVATCAGGAHDEAVPPERVLPVFREMIAGLSVFTTGDPTTVAAYEAPLSTRLSTVTTIRVQP